MVSKYGFAARFNAFYAKAISIHRDKMPQLKAMQDDDVSIWLTQLDVPAGPIFKWQVRGRLQWLTNQIG